MIIRIAKITNHPTVSFAADELKKYLMMMYKGIYIDVMLCDKYDSNVKNAIWLGCDKELMNLLPKVPNAVYDDAYYIDVKDNSGVLTGVNERSVLLGAYRLLKELGCSWVRPGADGEIIPIKEHENITVHVSDVASYRHRGICIEGANTFENIYNMIDWMPKNGMNGYFIQFLTPFEFFRRWYNDNAVPKDGVPPLTKQDVLYLQKQVIDEIKKRSLLYHAVGHSWTCEPFGIDGGSWYEFEGEIPEEFKEFLALREGKREFWNKTPLNSQLCYSHPKAREIMLQAIFNHCKNNPEIDFLHFWLGDGENNHCECEECQKLLPSDIYVSMLNDLDAMLTEAGLPTRIVFLIYVDLLWEPQKYRLNNPDRFVLMFAPITRSYSKTFSDFDRTVTPELSPYVRNKLVFPSNVGENVARLARWQEIYKGDSFDFDYHLMWDHTKDPGYYDTAKILFEDMSRLWEINLNGMISCQLQRVGYPTALPLYMMARALWNKNLDFENEAVAYFEDAFGKDGMAVKEYLSTLSKMFNLPYIRGEVSERINHEIAENYAKVPAIVEEMLPLIEKNANDITLCDNVRKSWYYLTFHAKTTVLFAKGLECRAKGDSEKAALYAEELQKYHNSIASDLQRVYDTEISSLYACRAITQ